MVVAVNAASLHGRPPCGGNHSVVESATSVATPIATSLEASPLPSSTSPSTTSPSDGPCYVTEFSAIQKATAACTSITLDSITVPGNSTIDLSKLQKGTKVTFKGKTFWEYFDANYPFIKIGGTDLEITAEEGAVLDGNGQAWWDGLGSNGGVKK